MHNYNSDTIESWDRIRAEFGVRYAQHGMERGGIWPAARDLLWEGYVLG
jgi:hypothetical protein